ncbi:threonine-phosphate decarboxylase CobD [Marinobacterium sediminicola]|uniref:threonine-phosphate decarboxylase n=1 Tax=Marinobacterium sediminicola TaxID=518898 RepID=A0ABY1S1X4_9GAMM|nr:threonine-phosphate decarboxylase CobD [Marinobacterium sediminicola]ULG69423.1 threonine-phosphate decarboxylase CobD [Marinobacterium sediminicola]SMR75573.1 L-threonine O-3-phosphate decarboxylase [Marinobacterium sediminicola]
MTKRPIQDMHSRTASIAAVDKQYSENVSPAPLHGGRLNAAVAQYGIPREQWLDLSTGINPESWPVPPIPAEVFNRLPEEDDGLQSVASEYYGSRDLLLVPGSQAAIQALPELRLSRSGRAEVGVLYPGYAEHAFRWQQAGHRVSLLESGQIEARLDRLDVLVLINPCNPSGRTFSYQQLLDWHARLVKRCGWLLVDEAFIDATPEQSLISDPMPAGLIILRSLGKFFGLAGLRVGAVCAHAEVRDALAHRIGPWALSHPARWLARQALADNVWQQTMRAQLAWQQARLQALLTDTLGEKVAAVSSTALFATVLTEQAPLIEQRCAQAGILVRRFEQPAALRFGLPGDEGEWQRLESVLNEIRHD